MFIFPPLPIASPSTKLAIELLSIVILSVALIVMSPAWASLEVDAAIPDLIELRSPPFL